MSGATDADARAVLIEHGRPVGTRGRLSAAQWEEYHQIMGTAAADDDWPTTDLDDATPPAHVDDNSSIPDQSSRESSSFSADDDDSAPRAERRPRRVATGGGAGARARALWDRRPKDGPAPKRARGKGKQQRRRQDERPWHPTAALIEHVWTRAAQAAGGLPPLQRILAAQAPLAGMALQGQLRGTITDRLVLQPLARWEDRSDTMAAVIGVPAMVALISSRGRVVMDADKDGKPVPVLDSNGVPVWEPGTGSAQMAASLKYCLIAWLEVNDRYAADVIEQAEQTIRRGAEADRLMAWIFGPPGQAAGWQEAAAGQAPPAGSWPASPPPEPAYGPGPSAFHPALTASVLGPSR